MKHKKNKVNENDNGNIGNMRKKWGSELWMAEKKNKKKVTIAKDEDIFHITHGTSY